MTPRRALAGLGLLVTLQIGCGGAESPPSTPAEPPPGASAAATRTHPRVEDFVGVRARSPDEYLVEPRLAAADAARGELLAYACRACHALSAGERNPLGPNLAGVFGRAAGTGEFDYSEPLREADIVWTPEALDAWLAAPTEFIPGTKMAFTGYQSASDRRDLIAYLLRETS